MRKAISLFFLFLSFQLISQDITWQTPAIQISTMGIDATDVQIRVDFNGNAVAVWLENGFVVSKTNSSMGTWSGSLSTLSATGMSSSPRLVVDRNGNATAIWVESGAINTASMPAGMSWGSVTTLAVSGGSTPQLTVDQTGNVVAVWVESGAVMSSTKLFGMSWQMTPDTLASSGDTPQVALSASGRVMAVWHAIPISLINTIFSSTKTLVGGVWGMAQTVSDPTLQSAFPQVAIDQFGNSVATWYTYNLTVSGMVNIYTNVIFTGAYRPLSAGAWVAPTPISNQGIRNPADFTSRILFSGTSAIALWLNSYDGETFSVETTILNVGRGLAPSPIVENLYSLSSALTVTSNGDAFAIYPFYDMPSGLILAQVSQSNVGGAVQQYWISTNLSNGTNIANPAVAVVANLGTANYGAAAWVGSDGMNKIIQAVMASGTQVLPPSMFMVMQHQHDYISFQEYYNTLTWTASPDPYLLGYVLYRNGILWKQVPADTTTIDDHNRGFNQPVVYRIQALNVNFSQSASVIVNFP